MRAWLMRAALCAVLGGFVALPAAPAGAAPLSDCNAHRGTIVAVDFAHWGGPIVRGCGVGQPSGYALLHAAGFTTAGDEYDGPSFICRLGDRAFHDGTQYPTPSEDPCIQTPPASAYWSYWLAPAGQSKWSYSQLGPMGEVPRPGEVELWTFGATSISGTSGSGVPAVSPSALRAASAAATTRTASTTSTSRHTTSTKTTSTSTHTSSTTTSTSRSTNSTTSTTPTTTATTTTSSSSSSSTPTTSTTSKHTTAARATHTDTSAAATSVPRLTTAPPSTAAASSATAGRGQGATAGDAAIVPAQTTRGRSSSGSAVPVLVGICLVLVLAGGAGWATWRRRHDQ